MGNAASFDGQEVPAKRATGAPNRPAVVQGRVPPHNLQAEESLLGAMLLSRAAITFLICSSPPPMISTFEIRMLNEGTAPSPSPPQSRGRGNRNVQY